MTNPETASAVGELLAAVTEFERNRQIIASIVGDYQVRTACIVTPIDDLVLQAEHTLYYVAAPLTNPSHPKVPHVGGSPIRVSKDNPFEADYVRVKFENDSRPALEFGTYQKEGRYLAATNRDTRENWSLTVEPGLLERLHIVAIDT